MRNEPIKSGLRGASSDRRVWLCSQYAVTRKKIEVKTSVRASHWHPRKSSIWPLS